MIFNNSQCACIFVMILQVRSRLSHKISSVRSQVQVIRSLSVRSQVFGSQREKDRGEREIKRERVCVS